MKVKSKISGDVGELRSQLSSPVGSIKYFVVVCGTISYNYDSLAELNEEWEGYEEPKYFWSIDDVGVVGVENEYGEENIAEMKQIGNYFETKEEAEQAVEKLKAWKRLKDKGFKFEGIKEDWTRMPTARTPFRYGRRYLQFNKSEDKEWLRENRQDLDLLFGGEDE